MVEQYLYSHFVDNIFVVAACTAGKDRQGRFIREYSWLDLQPQKPRKLPAIRYLD